MNEVNRAVLLPVLGARTSSPRTDTPYTGVGLL